MVGFILLAALFTAAPDAPDPPQGDIVVEGVRLNEQRVRAFVKALTDVPNFGQIGRFHSAVCPAAIGLPAEQNGRIADRMRRVARAANIRVGPANCSPNVFLIAAPDKRRTIEELNRKFPAYFDGMADREVGKLAASPDLAVAWQVKGLLNADGEALKKLSGDGYYINEGTFSPSRVKSASMPHFVASIVVVELEALRGLSVTQVADYASMRAFADTDPRRAAASGAPTILTIVGAPKDQPVPITLTHWDLGYLKSLYATSNAYYASFQRGDMEHVLKKELAQSGQPGN